MDSATLNWLTATGILFLELGAVALFLAILFYKKDVHARVLVHTASKYSYPLALLLALGGTIGALYYSEVVGYAPCSLCWFERIFLFPQIVVLAIGWKCADAKAAMHSFWLSFIGLLIALYHHALQINIVGHLPCPANGGATDCAQRLIFEYGHITFPYFALVIFATILLLMIAREMK